MNTRGLVRLVATVAGVLLVASMGFGAGQVVPTTRAAAEAPVEFTLLLRGNIEVDPENSPWVDELRKRSNTKIHYLILPWSGWIEKRNVMLAGGTYPEVIMMDAVGTRMDALYEDLKGSGIILPLDDYFQYAPNIEKYTYPISMDAVRDRDGGKTYIVPQNTLIRVDFMMLRRDWREKIGMSYAPRTIEDWKRYFHGVTYEDPDGNGKADTYGLFYSDGFLGYFGAAWNIQGTVDDGSGALVDYGPYAKDGRYKELLQFFRDLVADGVVDPESLTYKDVYWKRWQAGITGIHNSFAGDFDTQLVAIRQVHPGAQGEFAEYPVDPKGQNYKRGAPLATQNGLYYGYSLTNKAKGKEIGIFKFFEYLLSDEGWNYSKWGIEGVHHKMQDGKYVTLPAFDDYSKRERYLSVFRRPTDASYWLSCKIPEYCQYQTLWFDKSIRYYEENYIQNAAMIGFQTEKGKEFAETDFATRKVLETRLKIIYGELPVSAWDAIITEAYKLGYEDILKESNAYYRSTR